MDTLKPRVRKCGQEVERLSSENTPMEQVKKMMVLVMVVVVMMMMMILMGWSNLIASQKNR